MAESSFSAPRRASVAPSGLLKLRQLEVFHAIMLTGSVSAAGRLLHVSQPAVSKLLSTMEMRLGFQLFDRAGGRLHPTRQARHLFREVDAIHSRVLEVNQLLSHLAAGKGEVLYVASSPGFSQWVIPSVVTEFKRRHHDVSIKYRPLSLDNLLPPLLTGEVELAMSIVPPEHPNIVYESIPIGSMVCLLPKGHALTKHAVIRDRDLDKETILRYGADTPLARLSKPFWISGIETQKAPIEVRSTLTACNFVRCGGAVALVDSFVISSSVASEVEVRPIEPEIPLTVYISHSRTESLSLTATAFIRAFKTVLHEDYRALADRLDLP